MYTDGPEMNFRTASLDLPQNEQRRWRSCVVVFIKPQRFSCGRRTAPNRRTIFLLVTPGGGRRQAFP
jgi:hypothetical protein